VAGDSGDIRTARRWDIALACVAGALIVAAVGVATAVALPPSLSNLASEVSDGVTATAVGDASVVVPADWIITRESDDAISVTTPDGVLRARLDVVSETPAETVERSPASSALRTEMLASGLTAVHADFDDGGLVAGVGSPDARPSVRVVVEVRAAHDAAQYRAAIGELLEGVRA